MSQSKPKQPSYLNRLKQQFASLVWRVRADGVWQRGNSSAQHAEPKRRVPFVVLARELYSEQWQSFAIRSKRELQKVLRLRDHDNSVMHFIGDEHEGRRSVLTVTLSQAALVYAQKAYIVLPETLVLNAALDDGVYFVQAAKQNYYLHRNQRQWQSVPTSPLIKDEATAKLALGVSASRNVATLKQNDVQSMLPEGVLKLGLSYWQQGWRKVESDKPFAWQQALTLSAGVIVLYGLISTAYLSVDRWWTEQQLAEIEPAVSDVLADQNAVNQARATIEELQRFQTNWRAVNNFWQVYRVTEEQNVELRFLRGDFRELTLSGLAENALPFMQDLNASGAVATSDFASPVRANGGQQSFIIEMTLANQGGSQ